MARIVYALLVANLCYSAQASCNTVLDRTCGEGRPCWASQGDTTCVDGTCICAQGSCAGPPESINTGDGPVPLNTHCFEGCNKQLKQYCDSDEECGWAQSNELSVTCHYSLCRCKANFCANADYTKCVDIVESITEIESERESGGNYSLLSAALLGMACGIAATTLVFIAYRYARKSDDDQAYVEIE